MKILLVTLLLAAGFVTVASADPLDCTNNTTNQCCIDLANIQSAISQSSTHTVPTAVGTANIWSIDDGLTNAASDNCMGPAVYTTMGGSVRGLAGWYPGSWWNSLYIDNQ